MKRSGKSFRDRLDVAHSRHFEKPLSGILLEVSGGVLRVKLETVAIGDTFLVARTSRGPLLAEVVSFDQTAAMMLPFEEPTGLRPGAIVEQTDLGKTAPAASDLLGGVVDALGRSLRDGRQHAANGFPLRAKPPAALGRRAIDTQLHSSIRAIDGLLPFGEGQRIGLFAGSGVGKSSLLAQLVRGTDADVVVVGLVGERGREVGEFVNDVLDSETRKRTTIVVATSDAPPMLRMRAAEMATAIAEEWRSKGKHCLLLVDSLTRYARALREAALLAGEPPARRGYPASVFAQLPCLLERTGQSKDGSISAVYTVLVEGGDMEEPIADEVRGIVDGHWVLRRDLAEKGHFPAIDVLSSVSRVANRVVSESQLADMKRVRHALSELSQHRDAIDLGIYKRGTSPALDAAIKLRPKITGFLVQAGDESTSAEDTRDRLRTIALELPSGGS